MKPKAVRDAEEEANRLLGELNKPVDPAVPPDPATPPAPEPVVTPEPLIAPIPPVVPPIVPEPLIPVVDHEQRYKTLQGKYDVEVPKLYGEVGDLKVRLAEALTVITELQKAPVVPVTPTPAATPPPGIGYMRKEMPEMEDAVRYIVKEEATKLVKELVGDKVGEVDTKLNKLEADTVKNAGNTFYNDLAIKVPTWSTINENADFLKWLDGVEPYTGYKKMELLQDAVGKLDVSRTAKFFSDFITEATAGVKPTVTPDRFVSPPKPAGGGEPIPPTDTGYITSGEITKFYNDVAVGKYRNKDQERVAIEAKINKALLEGKIR